MLTIFIHSFSEIFEFIFRSRIYLMPSEFSKMLSDVLSQAAGRTGQSKTREACMRLEDHLKFFTDLATPRRRFTAEVKKMSNSIPE